MAPAATDIIACSAPGLASWRFTTSAPSALRRFVVIRCQPCMRFRIEAQLKLTPCDFRRVRIRCTGWYANAAIRRWEAIRPSS